MTDINLHSDTFFVLLECINRRLEAFGRARGEGKKEYLDWLLLSKKASITCTNRDDIEISCCKSLPERLILGIELFVYL